MKLRNEIGEQGPKVALMDPFRRLQILSEYMVVFIDEWPLYKYSFNDYIHRYHSHEIPDTPDYYKVNATHCFYCNDRLIDSRKNYGDVKRATVDHYQPKSKEKTTRYVICCAECNCKKDSIMPDQVVSKLTLAMIRGRPYMGFTGDKLKHVMNQFQIISNDLLYNTGPRVYYIIKKGKNGK